MTAGGYFHRSIIVSSRLKYNEVLQRLANNLEIKTASLVVRSSPILHRTMQPYAAKPEENEG